MRIPLMAIVLCWLGSAAYAGQPDAVTDTAVPVTDCDRCEVILNEIRDALLERCEAAPGLDDLRQKSIYLFLSIFDEVSQGGDRSMAGQIYNAALEGMECSNPDAGVKAAQQVAKRLMVENRT